MERFLLRITAGSIFFIGQICWAQQPISIKSKKPVICYQSFINKPDHIQAPENFRHWKAGRTARVKTANFEVEYIDFPADNKAKDAFQFAIDIWETQLTSSVTIKVRAQWASLEAGVLGQAIWGTAIANFDGAQHINTFYPVALAEKIAGKELNPSADPDIVATFSSKATWYLGTDGNTPIGKMDLVTVVLHEIGHGLGFTDTYNVESTEGSVGLENGGQSVPFVYDLFIENAGSQKLFTQFVSPSAAMRTQLISNNIFYNSPLAKAAMGGAALKIYAPDPFNDGSSIAHLDETTYSGLGNVNKLMTPQIAPAESIHDPGPILLNIFKDMGWVFTKIQHTPLTNIERKDGAPYVVRTKIVSDNGYDQTQVLLNYTIDNVNFTQVVMTSAGTPSEFTASLPGMTTNGGYGYFISVVDVLNRTFTNPGKIQEQNKAQKQSLIVFNIGPDTNAPEIAHTPVDYIFNDETTLSLTASVTDNIGVDAVKVDYSIKGGSQQTLPLQKTSLNGNEYKVTISLPALNIGDKISYRIVATDKSLSANKGFAPATGFTTVFVTGIMPTRDSYINNFNQSSIDFIGNSFAIKTPAAFENGAIHSDHPYNDGSGVNNESNYVYQLQVPIRINNSNPFIRFDEIVLVEPGEDGSVFGDDDFYDYAVVEASKDGGTTWKILEDGYDSRDNNAWLNRYNGNISNNNSQAVGTPTFFRERVINMLEKKNFVADDEVLIRFRLFADQASHGWGWAIDNLSIQGTITGIERQASGDFKVYPNPVAKNLTIEMFQTNAGTARIQIYDLLGQEIFSEEVSGEADVLHHDIDLSTQRAGVYVLKAEYGEKTVSRKFFKVSE